MPVLLLDAVVQSKHNRGRRKVGDVAIEGTLPMSRWVKKKKKKGGGSRFFENPWSRGRVLTRGGNGRKRRKQLYFLRKKTPFSHLEKGAPR